MVELVLTLPADFEASRQGGAFAAPVVDIVFDHFVNFVCSPAATEPNL